MFNNVLLDENEGKCNVQMYSKLKIGGEGESQKGHLLKRILSRTKRAILKGYTIQENHLKLFNTASRT